MFASRTLLCCGLLLCGSWALAQEAATTRRTSALRRSPLTTPRLTEANNDAVMEDASIPTSELAPIQNVDEAEVPLAGTITEEISPEDAHVGHRHRSANQQGYLSANDGCTSCNGWGCDQCSGAGGYGAGGGFGGRNGPLSGFYARKELLYWWTKGMYVPSLVSTSPDGTARGDAGVLGTPGASTLFGEQGINNGGRLGGRITMGYWLDGCQNRAIEGDFFYLGNLRQQYSATSLGSPILSRPYYDIQSGSENAELVAYPGVLAGTVSVDPLTKFMGAGLRTRWNMCSCGCYDPCNPCGQNNCRIDFTLGYRMLRLSDQLNIREDLTSLDPQNPGSFVVNDQFRTWNTFHGVEFGTVYARSQGLWSMELLSRMSVGMTSSHARINGFTDITSGGLTTNNVGGLLAQRTNIGDYYHEAFAIAPELGMTAGYQIRPGVRLICGYTLIYWTNVLRAGQLIDRNINKDLIPPETTVTGPLRPIVHLQETDFWAMGVNLGLDARW